MTSVQYESDPRLLPFDSNRLFHLYTKLSEDLDISNADLKDAAHSIALALPSTITVDELLHLAAESLAQKIVVNPDFSLLAGRVDVHAIHRSIPHDFATNFERLHRYLHPKTRHPQPLVSDEASAFVKKHADFLNRLIVSSRDNDITFFGMRTLAKSYLIKANNRTAETPQYMFLRVAIGIHALALQGAPEAEILSQIARTYNLMSQKYFIHSSPTLFNAATVSGYLSLCFLMAVDDDSIDGIYKSLHKAALISKASGGIGIHVNNIRSNGSLIRSSNGTSNGLVPMLRVFNSTARYVDQGGNKRPGAIAVYVEPWHGDIEEILDLRKNHGPEELRARDLFYALWIPDLFMKRVKNNEDWSLFSPSEAPGLSEVYGDEFEDLYNKYEEEGLAITLFKARKLWVKILETQTETGMPFMLYKDSCNKKLNQKNCGTIKSSNLCCEIVQYLSEKETAVCNLALLALPSYVVETDTTVSFDFQKLHEVTKCVTRNLDQVIDSTLYPTKSAKVSNLRNRPLAIGVQGLADVFMQLRLPFDSEEAKQVNVRIFETIYHGAIESSMELAKEKGHYESFKGSPASFGVLQFDMWNCKPTFFDDWDELKERIMKHGLRNSLLVAPMPTASTSQILGFNECFEPLTSNIYLRRVLSGEFQVVNKNLVKDLIKLGIWNNAMKEQIIIDDGLIQNIDIIPQPLKDIYKTVWEISQKSIVDMAVARGSFIDQLQSLNIHLKSPTFKNLTSCHFYGWERGLKTGMYYLRTKAASRAIQFSVDATKSALELESMSKPDISLLMAPKYIETRSYPKKIPKDSNPRRKLAALKRSLLLLSTPNTYVSLSRSPSTDNSEVQSKEQSPKAITSSKTTSPEEDYDIYDTTPISCNIANPENCESCSA